MNKITPNQIPFPEKLAAEPPSTSNELPAKMIPSIKDLTTTKSLQSFKASHHTEAFKDFEVSLDVAKALYSASNPELSYDISLLYRGDKLKISLLKAHTGSQENYSPDNRQDFLCELLSEGGTKKVFKITISGENFAIAIPTEVRKRRIWHNALMETKLTEQIRKLKVKTIPFHKIVIAEVDGVTFPAIVMPLFSEIGGHITDHKNASILDLYIDDMMVKNQITGKTLPVKEIPDEDSLIGIMQHAIRDAAVLAKNNIGMDFDAVNFQISESGDVELFLFDLPVTMNVDSNRHQLCHSYAKRLIDCFDISIDNHSILPFDSTASNSKLVEALTVLIYQSADPNASYPESSRKRKRPENPSVQDSSCTSQKKKGNQRF